jgi:divalent metal cation (Fe/Co/Zn/Cd) transporter
MDTAPGAAFVQRVETAARAVPGVTEVEKCYVRKMGLSFYCDLHIKVDGGITVREGHDIAHKVKRAIQDDNARIADALVHVEPHAGEDR